MQKGMIFVLLGVISFLFDVPVAHFIGDYRLPFFSFFFVFLSDAWVIFAGLVLFSFFQHKKKRMGTFIAMAAAGLSYFVTLWIKFLVARPRPFLALGIESLVPEVGYSFPSAHAGLVFAILAFAPKSRWWLAFALLVSFSRLYLGVHYLSDVIFGALIGYGIGCGVQRWKTWFQH